MLSTDTGCAKGKRMHALFWWERWERSNYLTSTSQFPALWSERFELQILGKKKKKWHLSVLMKRIFARRMPCAKAERSEVTSRLAPRGFERSFKETAVVTGSPDHRVRHRDCHRGDCHHSPTSVFPSKARARILKMCLGPAEAGEAQAPACGLAFRRRSVGCTRESCAGSEMWRVPKVVLCICSPQRPSTQGDRELKWKTWNPQCFSALIHVL